jgi:phosphoribosylformylglycinamidine (FGAM) synthase-like enzyme
MGGVIRDIAGDLAWARKPMCQYRRVLRRRPRHAVPSSLPPGVHPSQADRCEGQIVAGVRDYGNRMGIPTVNGAVLLRSVDYLGNPLVYLRLRGR